MRTSWWKKKVVDNMIYKYPLKYIAITNLYSNTHKGLDLGWTSKIEGCGKNQPIYACADGIIYSTKDNDNTNKSWGNYVKIKHSDNTYSLYAHLKQGLCVKKGDIVKMGDLIGYMGKTGKASGNHLHFEIYVGGVSTKYRVDPLKLSYVFNDQIVCESDKNIVKYYEVEPVENKIKLALEKTFEIEAILKELL